MKKQIKFFYAKSIKEVEYQVNNWIRKYSSESINRIVPVTDGIYFTCMVEYLIRDNSGSSEEKRTQ
jgi:hypothetical protein